jgi:hypothetical protein
MQGLFGKEFYGSRHPGPPALQVPSRLLNKHPGAIFTAHLEIKSNALSFAVNRSPSKFKHQIHRRNNSIEHQTLLKQ